MSTLPTGTAGQDKAGTYTTKPGESVMGIALRQCGHEMEWRHILACNPEFARMLPHEYFPVGTVLTLPPPPAAASPAHEAAPSATAADYEEVLAEHRRLVRELDVLLNGEEGAAKQASLCDIVAQVRREKGQQGPLGADLPRFPVELRKMWSGGEVQRWLDDRIAPRFKVLRNALDHVARVARGSRGQSRRNRWIELRALGALNGTDEWRTVDLPKNGEGVRRRLEHEIGELQAVKQALQKALAYWMPKVFDERSAHDAYLLVGYEGETEESWGEKMQAELARLNAIINAPQSGDFLRAVSTEAEHQRQRWGHHDAGKVPGDWYRLVGYLAHKALLAILSNDREKGEHHVITTAAALANWHRTAFGNTAAPAALAPCAPYAWRDTGPLETGDGHA
ncbi:hypothetical protein BcepIL02_gp03 [Burkholderia phage BcepIL02]|uniref:LysM domain-containing protein n=1 Tax=Burkholderia phage BcepIL02 TaxID=2886898 RepID=C5IHJ5_9CAUD|nr:hypothetical protein BcepIL02_gp03 [Burkholderia phage BcepIL02]ACR14996.1 hypothetical protein BcepIL02_gp03 [Burkholderia phage BcepIL02]